MHETRTICYRAAALAVAASVGLAACGGGSKTPSVASLNGAKGDSAPTTTIPKGTATQLLNEWASCMRAHGDPNQTDPVIDSNGVIHITEPADPTGSIQGAQNTCESYLSGASTALGGRSPSQRPSYAKLLAFSKCMRSHGIPDFPDPSSGGTLSLHSSPGSDLDPRSPTFQAASATCAKSAGVPGLADPGAPRPGQIQIQSSGGPGPGAAGGGSGGSGEGISTGGNGGTGK